MFQLIGKWQNRKDDDGPSFAIIDAIHVTLGKGLLVADHMGLRFWQCNGIEFKATWEG